MELGIVLADLSRTLDRHMDPGLPHPRLPDTHLAQPDGVDAAVVERAVSAVGHLCPSRPRPGLDVAALRR